jgi:hypothetical protein
MQSRSVVNRVESPPHPPLALFTLHLHPISSPTSLSIPMKHQEPDFSIHLPPPRVALILNLIVRPQMPLSIALATPKWIVTARICRLDASWIICAALRRDAAILHLYVFARGAVVARLGSGRMRTITRSRAVAVRHVVRRGGGAGAGRVYVSLCGVAVGRGGVVVGALVGGIEVSKRVQRAVRGEVVEAVVRGRVVVGGAVAVARAIARAVARTVAVAGAGIGYWGV